MNSGRFNCLLVIERDDTARGATGGRKAWTTPATVATVWARMMQVIFSARESQGSPDFPVSRTPINWIIRQMDTIKPDMRIKWVLAGRARYFEIRAIKQGPPNEQNMVIESEEVV